MASSAGLFIIVLLLFLLRFLECVFVCVVVLVLCFCSSRMCRKMLDGTSNHAASEKHRSRAAEVIQRPYHHMIWDNYDFQQQLMADRQIPGAAEDDFLG